VFASGSIWAYPLVLTMHTCGMGRVKMLFIVLAMIVLRQMRNRVFRNPSFGKMAASTDGKLLASLSLGLWALSITAGRLMAYLGPVSGLK
jgi:hypothetical protein